MLAVYVFNGQFLRVNLRNHLLRSFLLRYCGDAVNYESDKENQRGRQNPKPPSSVNRPEFSRNQGLPSIFCIFAKDSHWVDCTTGPFPALPFSPPWRNLFFHLQNHIPYLTRPRRIWNIAKHEGNGRGWKRPDGSVTYAQAPRKNHIPYLTRSRRIGNISGWRMENIRECCKVWGK